MKSTTAWLLCLAFLNACANPIPSDLVLPLNEPTNQKKQEPSPLLQGGWVTACRETVENAAPYRSAFAGYIRREMKLEDSTFTWIVTGHSTPDCAESNTGVIVGIAGTYALGAHFQSLDSISTTPGNTIDFQFAESFIMPITENAALALNNGNGYCRKKNWRPLEKQTISELNCPDAMLDAGLVPFNVIALTNDQLVLGSYYLEANVGTDGAHRPKKWAWGEELARAPEDVTPLPATNSAPTPAPTVSSSPGPVPATAIEIYKSIEGIWWQDGADSNRRVEWQFSTSVGKYFFTKSTIKPTSSGGNSGELTPLHQGDSSVIHLFTHGGFGSVGWNFEWDWEDVILCRFEVHGRSPGRKLRMNCGAKNGNVPATLDGAMIFAEHR